MKVFFYDIENKLPLGNAQQVRHLSDLLNMSDVVTLHVPETPATKNMMGAEELALMKPGAILINASRGTVVDIPALCDTLASNHRRARRSTSSRKSRQPTAIRSTRRCVSSTTCC